MDLNRLIHELNTAKENLAIVKESPSYRARKTILYWENRIRSTSKQILNIGGGTISRVRGKKTEALTTMNFEIYYINLSTPEIEKLLKLDIQGVTEYKIENLVGRQPRRL